MRVGNGRRSDTCRCNHLYKFSGVQRKGLTTVTAHKSREEGGHGFNMTYNSSFILFKISFLKY